LQQPEQKIITATTRRSLLHALPPGKFLGSCFGHVGAVYQIAWSSDSRLLVSASKDSTVKVWDAKTRKLAMDLPGHADEVRVLRAFNAEQCGVRCCVDPGAGIRCGLGCRWQQSCHGRQGLRSEAVALVTAAAKDEKRGCGFGEADQLDEVGLCVMP
jgi:hypothetical protein